MGLKTGAMMGALSEAMGKERDRARREEEEKRRKKWTVGERRVGIAHKVTESQRRRNTRRRTRTSAVLQ